MNRGVRAVHEIILTVRAGETFTTYGPWRPGQGFEVGAFRAHLGGRTVPGSDGTPLHLPGEFFRYFLAGGAAAPILGLVVKVALAPPIHTTDVKVFVELERMR